jgi:uncharacterized protein YfaS (alpha-2-macroglobulin family)
LALPQYGMGDLVRMSAKFTATSTGLPVDPSTVTVKVRNPSGAVVTYVFGTDSALVHDGLGQFHVDVPVTAQGVWYYRFESTGSGQAANEQSFFVKASKF